MLNGTKALRDIGFNVPRGAKFEPQVSQKPEAKWLRYAEAFSLFGRGAGSFHNATKDGRIKTKMGADGLKRYERESILAMTAPATEPAPIELKAIESPPTKTFATLARNVSRWPAPTPLGPSLTPETLTLDGLLAWIQEGKKYNYFPLYEELQKALKV